MLLIHYEPHLEWHGVSVLPRAGWVLETRLHSWCPPYCFWIVSKKLQGVELNHRVRLMRPDEAPAFPAVEISVKDLFAKFSLLRSGGILQRAFSRSGVPPGRTC